MIEYTEPKSVYRVFVDLGSEHFEEAFFTSKKTAEDFVLSQQKAGRIANLNIWPWYFKIEK